MQAPVRPRFIALLLATAAAAGAALAQVDEAEAIRRIAAAGQRDEAMARVDRLLGARPKDPSLRFLKGVLLADAQRGGEALPWFERLTEDFPDLPEPYNNLAALYAGSGDYERARVALVAALRANPRYAVAQANLGDVHLQLARQAYQRAGELNPGDATVAPRLALTLTALRGLAGVGEPSAVVAPR